MTGGKESWVDGVILNLVASALWAGLWYGGQRLLFSLNTATPRRRRWIVVGRAALVFVVLAAALVLAEHWNVASVWGWLLVVLATGWLVVASTYEVNRFWRVGLLGADHNVGKGLDYDAALKLVTTQLSFMGTGAHKLSSSDHFQTALQRCRSDVPIRFLLRKPDDRTLAAAARRAGKPDDEYRKNVIDSLQKIQRLRESIENIEVRFYEGDLVFRVMIVDGRIGLVSYNVYGLGDGSTLPQLHLVEAAEGREASTSFFHAFERYFNERWAESQSWDFQAFVQ